MGKQRQQPKRAKVAAEDAQPSDLYEAEAPIPVEEQKKNINKRYDIADALEYELPSDLSDDEEIDEDLAFTEEDKKQYAGMFGDVGSGGDEDGPEDSGAGSLLMDSDASEDQSLNADDFSEEEGQEDPEEAAARHQAMLADIGHGAARPKRKRQDFVVTEALPESEMNLNPTAASEGGTGGQLQLSDLIAGLGNSRRKLGTSRKDLERLERRGRAVPAPLPGNVQARQERKAAYDITSKDVTKWQPMIKANREAPTLSFTAPRGESNRATTTAALASQFQSNKGGMEAEVAAMLRSAGLDSGQAVQRGEDALALKELSSEEAAARRDKLAKMRALLFYHEVKAKRMKAIKSKEYRRQLNKSARRKAKTAAAADGDSSALKEAAETAEFERAKERLTLKHKNTSKWARRALKRGVNVMDATTKEAMEEQLRIGLQLRQKVEHPASSSDTDSDGSTAASDSEDEADGSSRHAEKPAKDQYRKSRAAAMDVLQGAEATGSAAPKGLFALPFMRRAKEQQARAASAEASAMLRSIESEVTGVPEDELEPKKGSQPQGRFSFGASFGAPYTAAAPSSNDGSSGNEDEDEEARGDRLQRLRETDANMAAIESFTPTTAGNLRRDASTAGRSSRGTAKAGPVTASTRGQHSNGKGAPETVGAAAAAAAASARDEHRARDSRMFGDSSALDRPSAAVPAAGFSSAPVSATEVTAAVPRQQQTHEQVSGVSIRPASRVSTATLPATKVGKSSQQKKQRQRQGTTSSTDEEGNSSPAVDAAHAESVPDAMQPLQGAELTQEELIQMAFAGDDVAADFAAQKAAEAEEDSPKEEAPTGLPGWGSWANPRRMAREAADSAAKLKSKKEAALAKRKDAGRRKVVITEKWDRKAQQYAAKAVPFPFDSRDTYERSLRQPLGMDFNTTSSFKDLTRPSVIKEQGLIIQPLRYSKGKPDETTGGAGRGGSKGRHAKGNKQQENPPAQRARVKVVSTGRPR